MKFFLKTTGGVVILALLGFVALFIWLNLNEYKPAPLEQVPVTGNAVPVISTGQNLELYTWNIGYAALDSGADFFMEGGKGVRPASRSIVEKNIWAIRSFLAGSGADFVFLQEVDRNSRRSWGIDEAGYFAETWKGGAAYALNYVCSFIPYPVPRFMGRVESGLLTLSLFNAYPQAERVALPVAFDWPLRLGQLKRCLLVERFPVRNSAAELALVNFHLEAYDSGEGREEQTKVLLEFLKAEYGKGNYCVSGGDFNLNLPGAEENFPLKNENAGFVPGVFPLPLPEGFTLAVDSTTPSARLLDKPYAGREDHQFYVIDGFLVSPNVAVESVQTLDLDFRNSDHNPVKLTFSLRP